MILAGICFCAMMAGASSQPIWFRYTDAPATASSTANTSSTSAVSPTTTTPPITTAGPEFQTIFPSSGILPQAVEIKDPDVMDAIYNTLTPTMQAHVEEVRQKLGVMLFYLGDNKCVYISAWHYPLAFEVDPGQFDCSPTKRVPATTTGATTTTTDAPSTTAENNSTTTTTADEQTPPF